MKILIAALVLSTLTGCASSEADRQREIDFLEDRLLGEAHKELEAVKAQAADGTITPELAAVRTRAIEARIAAIQKRIEAVRSQPSGVSFLETILIAAATALGLRGAPTGGAGGFVVSLIAGLFGKKKTLPAKGAA